MKYHKPTITIHSNFNEAAEAQEKHIAQQNPVDRIKETVQLILRVYSISPKKTNTNLIYIDRE
ncbi:MAG: hypothetical protein H7141_09690 [Burkholderiales bacterium]|nr:hypothetical protein [Bacteroidia bacterium]